MRPSSLVRSIGWLSLAWILAFAAGSGVRVERLAEAAADATSGPAATGADAMSGPAATGADATSGPAATGAPSPAAAER